MILAIDLDGTLAAWPEGGHGGSYVFDVGDWIEGAEDALRRLLTRHTVVVHTCRATWEAGGGTAAVDEFLRSGGFTPVHVVGQEMGSEPGAKTADDLRSLVLEQCGTCEGDAAYCSACGGVGTRVAGFEVGVWVGVGKPIAHVYIDDRALRFDPSLGWASTLEQIGVHEMAVALQQR